MSKMNFFSRLYFSSLFLFSLFLLTACLTTSPQNKQKDAIFYPQPPELPRLQFLKSFSGAKDIEPDKSAFESFVTGNPEKRMRLDKPYGIAMHDGKMYVSDTNATVMIFDFKTKKFERLEGAKGLGSLVQPINISITKAFCIYKSPIL